MRVYGLARSGSRQTRRRDPSGGVPKPSPGAPRRPLPQGEVKCCVLRPLTRPCALPPLRPRIAGSPLSPPLAGGPKTPWRFRGGVSLPGIGAPSPAQRGRAGEGVAALRLGDWPARACRNLLTSRREPPPFPSPVSRERGRPTLRPFVERSRSRVATMPVIAGVPATPPRKGCALSTLPQGEGSSGAGSCRAAVLVA